MIMSNDHFSFFFFHLSNESRDKACQNGTTREKTGKKLSEQLKFRQNGTTRERVAKKLAKTKTSIRKNIITEHKIYNFPLSYFYY